MEKGREAAGTERIFEETGSGDMWYDVLDDVASFTGEYVFSFGSFKSLVQDSYSACFSCNCF